MPCPYFNKEKDNTWDGIYCNRMGGRPGVKYWKCYCDHRYSDCPIYGGDDPYELDPRTRERKKREEDKKKADEVAKLISYISYSVSVNDAREIENARYAYNRLTGDQKGYVSNYSKLTEAERALERARTEKENEEAKRRAQAYEQKKNTQNTSTTTQNTTYHTTYQTSKVSYGNNQEEKQDVKVDNTKIRYQEKFWFKVNPHYNNPSKLLIFSRIALGIASILGWYFGLPYNTPRAAEWMYLLFGGGQLFSLMFAYLCPLQRKLRLITWGVSGVALAVMIVLLYLNYNFEMVLFLILISFSVPIVWYGGKLLVKFAELVMKLL